MAWIIELDGLPEESVRLIGGLFEARVQGEVRAEDDRLRVTLASQPGGDLPDALAGWLAMLGIGAVKVRTRGPSSSGWVDGWGAVLPPVLAGERYEIASKHERSEVAPGRTRLVIEAPRSFGGGAHATTRLVAGLLEPLAGPGVRMLDVGTGSGVLAIVAAHAGADVTAFDVDPHAVEDARANAERNGVATRIRLFAGAIGDVDGEYGIVVANIFLAAIREMASTLAARAGTHLILSGLRGEEGDAVVGLFPGFVEARRAVEGDWCAVQLTRG